MSPDDKAKIFINIEVGYSLVVKSAHPLFLYFQT